MKSAEDLICLVDQAIEDLVAEFERAWTLFYREQDIGSRLYELIQSKLEHTTERDRSGKLHYLVHHEWPTPFKCDMKNGAFEIMHDDSNYHRGHYDIVVLNPEFVRLHDFDVVRSLTFANIREVLPSNYQGPYAVLYGIELMFRREQRNGKDSGWWRELDQDYRKLKASVHPSNLMQKGITLAFDAFPNSDRLKEFSRHFGGSSDIRYIVPMRATDNTVLGETSPMCPKMELVVEVGFEGGSATLWRRTALNGTFEFAVGSDEGTLADLLSDEDQDLELLLVRQPENWVESLEEGIGLFNRYGWERSLPLKIHPDYRHQIWECVLQNRPPERCLVRWADACEIGLEPPSIC